jgi:transcriptional regulator with XRE-family HTH domain
MIGRVKQRQRAEELGSAVGEALRTCRARRGMSQSELARLAQVDRSFVWQIESGGRQPTIAVFIALARALEISPDRLMRLVTRYMREPK